MSFLLHSERFQKDKITYPADNIEEFEWLFDRKDLAEFSELYSYDKNNLILAKLAEMGGVDGLAYALHTSLSSGLGKEDISPEGKNIRKMQFGKNVIEKNPPKGFLRLMWDALQDPMLVVLIVCGVANIPMGIIESGAGHGWVDGFAVLLAVVIVVFVTAINDYQKEKQFRNMEDKSADKDIMVLREGKPVEISHAEVMVGDIINVQNGKEIPCDGLVCQTLGKVKITEGALTGESDALSKNVHEFPFIAKGTQCVGGELFAICTGVGESTVYGKLMAGLLGDRKKQREAEKLGMTIEELKQKEADEKEPECCECCEEEETERTPLQVKLDVLARQIGYIGTGCSILLFEILLLKHYFKDEKNMAYESLWHSIIGLVFWIVFFYSKLKGYLEPYLKGVEDTDEEDRKDATPEELASLDDPFENPYVLAVIYVFVLFCVQWNLELLIRAPTSEAMEYFMVSVTIIVVAVPEGLPLAVTISLAYSMGKMFEDNNFVRKLAACETMGNATTICSDKTGTLTTNIMAVVRVLTGGKVIDTEQLNKTEGNLGDIIGEPLARLFAISIACNSKAYEKELEKERPKDEKKAKLWDADKLKLSVQKILLEGETNETEAASLLFCMQKLSKQEFYKEARADYPMIKAYPFDSAIKMSSSFVKHDEDCFRLYIKGAAERIVNASTHVAHVGESGEVEKVEFTEEDKQGVLDKMDNFAKSGLRCLAFGYREFTYDEVEWEKNESNKEEPAESFEIATKIVFLGLVGIKDPIRKEVPDAVRQCQKAGIVVRMVTGDHIDTARHIAKECGILTNEDQRCFTGEQFIAMLEDEKLRGTKEQTKIMEEIRVVARSRPADKEAMVQWYKEQHNDVVAVTGDGANDALALQEAHVGLAMFIQGTDVAQEASDIVIMDDNFASIVKTVMWGRSVYDNIRKFVQFQLCVNVVALSISLIAAFLDGLEVPLTAVQLLWVNLIMDTLAALALATEMPTPSLLDRRPYARDTHLISHAMWRFVAVHSTIQLIILLCLLTMGEDFLDLKAPHNFEDEDTSGRNETLMAICFNTFVWFQIFNEINARKVNGEWNVIEGFFDNTMFSSILLVTIICQFILVQYCADIAGTVWLDEKQWAFCVVVGCVSFPVGQLTLWFPVDLEQGMVDVNPDWFYIDKQFVAGHDSGASYSTPSMQ